MTYFSEKDISKQETLTIDRFNQLSAKAKFMNMGHRPTHSLVELMKWATEQVASFANTRCEIYETFIHNTINMDGSFMVFAEEVNAKITSIHTDALTSWQTDFDDEHFIGCGIFEVVKDDLKFYHCGLFHKGNQNEDEVSFFNIVLKTQVEKYISFRNEFSEWQNKRDRETREIEVIGGEPEPIKDLDLTWDDLILPKDIKDQIVTSIEGFLKSRELFKKLNCPWKSGMGFWGVPGCHAAGTGIVMFDGSVKKVEDVVVGDLLMGPDSLPREVLRLVRGQEEMFEIKPKKSDSFIVNKGHILHLKRSREKKTVPETLNMSVSDFLNLTEATQKSCYKMKQSDLIDFKKAVEPLKLDPYFLGLWLGDGSSDCAAITTIDKEIADFTCNFASENNCIVLRNRHRNSLCETIKITTENGKNNIVKNKLKEIGVLNNKHIPKEYLTASIEDRRKLLAGIIDTDGCYTAVSWNGNEKKDKKGVGFKGYFEVIQKREELARNIMFLAKSLGLHVTFKKCTKTIKSIDFSGEYYKLSIFGKIETIPVILPRKKAIAGKPNKNLAHRGIEYVKSVGIGDYYGFTLDSDHLYLTEDFFIHHNCGKSLALRIIMAQYKELKPVKIAAGIPDPNGLLEAAFDYAEEHAPAILYFEDFPEFVKLIGSTNNFLQLMDGVKPRDGILTIITGNDAEGLHSNIKNRPGRFDKFFNFPAPDQELAEKYLKRYFVDILSDVEIKELASDAVTKKFSYAYLREIYINSVYIAIAAGREAPSKEDIKVSMGQVSGSKKSSESNFSTKKRKMQDRD